MRRFLYAAILVGGLAGAGSAHADVPREPRQKVDVTNPRKNGIKHEVRAAEKSVEASENEPEEIVDNPVENMWSWGYNGKDIHGDPLKEGAHPMPPPFSMNLLNFAILVILLAKVAAPSLKRVVRERHDDIAKALAEGTRLRDEAKKKLDEYTVKLAGMQDEIDHLVAGIRAEAQAEQKRIVNEAEARATRMERDAKQQIDAEIRRVTVMLEREVAEAAVAAAETLLREKTTESDQRAFADKFIVSLQAAATKRGAPSA